MKHSIFITTLLLTIFALSCETNHLRGLYLCDQSAKKKDTTVYKEDRVESTLDITCAIEAFDFKGESTVEIRLANGRIASTYVIDNDYVRIKGTDSEILLKLIDHNILIGEGFPIGTYHKK